LTSAGSGANAIGAIGASGSGTVEATAARAAALRRDDFAAESAVAGVQEFGVAAFV
jgi:hypothetical protein